MKEPNAYDFVFDSQQELSKLGSDTEGKYLASLLLGNKTVNIKTQNGAWQGNFYLPQLDSLYPENHLILFQRYAGWETTVHYNQNEQMSIPSGGEKLMFSNTKNKWCKIGKGIIFS